MMKKVKGENDVTYDEAKRLCGVYLTLSTNQMLYNDLVEILGEEKVAQFKNKSVREIYNDIIMRMYPNEYAIKSSFINKVLLRGKSHVSIFELNVGSSRADLCKINGTSIAYEIKTDLDNFNRLEKQLGDYLQVFEQVYVICSSNRLEKVKELIPEQVGIYIYTSRRGEYTYKKEREAHLSNSLCPRKQLDIFTKQELSRVFGGMIVDELRNSKECLKQCILENCPPEKINNELKKCLKKRYEKQWIFLRDNHKQILDIDYQWFFKMGVDPSIIYY